MRQELNFEQIGKNIRAARIQKNLTQEYLADTIDVNVSHISNIENNRVKGFSHCTGGNLQCPECIRRLYSKTGIHGSGNSQCY